MNVKKSLLPNGLRLITIPIDGIESVACLVLTAVGSRYELKDKLGISHVLEHMAFKGTKKRPQALDIANLVEGVGGEWNAFTSNEVTGYWIKVASEHIEVALDVLSDVLTNARLDKKELVKEIGVIKEEKKMYYDSPSRHVIEMVEEQVFGDQPIGWSVIGTIESLNSISVEDLRKFIDTYYKTPNMVAVVAGKISPDLERKIEQYFKGLPKGKTPSFVPAVSSQTKPKVLIDKRPTEQAHLALGFEGMSRSDQDFRAFQVMNTLLGQGMSSRLFSTVREQQGLAYSVRSYEQGYHDTGIEIIYAGVAITKADKAISAILKELKRLTTEEVGSEELRKVKEFLKGRLKLGLEDTTEVAEVFGLQELLEKRILTVEDISNLIDRVTEKDILRVAARVFKTGKINLSLVGPFDDKNRFLKLLKV